MEAGLKRLDGARSVKLARFDDPTGTGVYRVEFQGVPALIRAALRKAAGRFRVIRADLRITAGAKEKDGAWWAGGYRLRGKADVLARLTALVKKGIDLELDGRLTDDSAHKRILVLRSVKAPERK